MATGRIICPYCGEVAVLRNASVLRGRSFGMAWVCKDYPKCDSYIGCRKGTTTPIGRMADKKTRIARKKAHVAFDPLWKSGGMLRGTAYRLLGSHLGLSGKQTHIGLFGVVLCGETVKFVELYNRKKRKDG